MTVIRPNSIAGVTSITAQDQTITLYSSNGTTISQLNTNINATSGVSTVANLNATGIVTASSFVGNLTGTASTATAAATAYGLSGNPSVFVSSIGINTTSVSGTKLYLQGSAAGNIVNIGSTTSTTTLDFSQGNNFSLTLGASVVIANPTGVTTGQSGVILIQEDGTGGYTCAWGTSWDFASSTAPTLTTTANALNALPYFARSATSIVVGSVIAGIGTL